MPDATEGSTCWQCEHVWYSRRFNHTCLPCLHAWSYRRFNFFALHNATEGSTCLLRIHAWFLRKVRMLALAVRFLLRCIQTWHGQAWLSVTLKETVETHWNTADLPGAKPNKHLRSSQRVALTNFKRVKIGSWRRKTGTTSWWNCSTYTSHIPGLQWSTGFRLCLMSWPLWEPGVNPACCYRLPEREVQFVALRVDSIFIGSGGGNRWKLYIFSHLQQVHQNTSVKH